MIGQSLRLWGCFTSMREQSQSRLEPSEEATDWHSTMSFQFCSTTRMWSDAIETHLVVVVTLASVTLSQSMGNRECTWNAHAWTRHSVHVIIEVGSRLSASTHIYSH